MAKTKNGLLRVFAFPMQAVYAALCFALAIIAAAAPATTYKGGWGEGVVIGAVLCLGVWFCCKRQMTRYTFTPEGFVRSGKGRRFVGWEEIRGAGSYAPAKNSGALPHRVVFLLTDDVPEIEIYRNKMVRILSDDVFLLAYRKEVLEYLAEHLPLDGWTKAGDKELYRRMPKQADGRDFDERTGYE